MRSWVKSFPKMGPNREFGSYSLGMCQTIHAAWPQISCMAKQDHRVNEGTLNSISTPWTVVGYLRTSQCLSFSNLRCISNINIDNVSNTAIGRKGKEKRTILSSDCITQKLTLEKTPYLPITSIAVTRLMLFCPFTFPVLILQLWSWLCSPFCVT